MGTGIIALKDRHNNPVNEKKSKDRDFMLGIQNQVIHTKYYCNIYNTQLTS